MKIIEAMKKLKVLEKRMSSNSEHIQQYSSLPSHFNTNFANEKEQSAEIKKLAQSNEDLLAEYLELKLKIEKTNIATMITIGGKTMSISSWLTFKRRMAVPVALTYKSMNDNNAINSMRRGSYSSGSTSGETKINRYYDEKFKNQKLREWEDIVGELDGRLEVVNATTDLVE